MKSTRWIDYFLSHMEEFNEVLAKRNFLSYEYKIFPDQEYCWFHLQSKESNRAMNVYFYLKNPITQEPFNIPLDMFFQNTSVKIFNFLMHHLLDNVRVFARNTEFVEVPVEKARHFLKEHHLLNEARARRWLGLLHQNVPVLMAGIGPGRKIYRDEPHRRSYEIVRLCSRSMTIVTGGLSRLLHHLSKEFPDAADFFTYVDEGWSTGDGMEKCGFEREHVYREFYFIVDPRKRQVSPFYPGMKIREDVYIRKSARVWKYRYRI